MTFEDLQNKYPLLVNDLRKIDSVSDYLSEMSGKVYPDQVNNTTLISVDEGIESLIRSFNPIVVLYIGDYSYSDFTD